METIETVNQLLSVTVFRHYTVRIKNATVQECIEEIKNGTYKTEVEEVRRVNAEEGKDAADKLKKNLVAFTPSGRFDTLRRIENITEYNQCVILDFDEISPEHLQRAKDTAILAPFTLAAFISPRGTGLKVMVRVSSGVEHHGLAFSKVTAYYETAMQEMVDPSGKDCSRLCFMSYDPEAWYNDDASVFKVSVDVTADKEEEKELTEDQRFTKLIDFTNRKLAYTNGSRNKYIHMLACNCNRNGLSEAFSEAKILENFDLDPAEISTTVQSAYKLNAHEFGKYSLSAIPAEHAKPAIAAADPEGPPEIDALTAMPYIPDQVYQNLPGILKEGAIAFADDYRKRDVFLTSALAVVSGCLPEVVGIYHQERVFPNLFSFIIAPAANGKGIMKNAKRLADKYHYKITDESKAQQEEYEKELLRYKAVCAKLKKGEEPPEKPEEPPYKRIFIPADTSQSMLIKMINDNGGNGIIFETEADTMSGANKQDWGNYSPLLRAAFHHESISIARKTNNEVYEIKEPKIAVCLSGTPAQVPRLIGSAENGLFSRFMFYAFRSPVVWQSPAPAAHGIVYTDHFNHLAEEVLQMVSMLEQFPTEVRLSPEQWQRFNEEFSWLLNQSVLFNDEDIAAVVYRLGLLTFRIIMQFTALRKFENGDSAEILYCSEEDFTAAITLSKVYIDHSILMFNNLSETASETKYKLPVNKQRLLDLLPDTFRRKEAIDVGNRLSLSTRTVDGLLQSLVPEVLEKIKDGYYRKTL